MEFLGDYTLNSSSSSTTKFQEPQNLIEQGWFFGNFPDKKTKISRCYSDPSPSLIPTQEILVTNSYDKEIRSSLKKKGSGSKEKGGSLKLKKANLCTNGLVRGPSLPPCIGKIEIDFVDDDDEESEFAMGRLIRQASINGSEIKLDPSNSLKVIKQSCSIPRQHPRKNPDILETITNKTRSKDNLESKQVEGFKNLDLNFKKLNLNPSLTWFDSSREQQMQKQKRPQDYAVPTLPNWAVDNKNSSKDMKAQIKFWARAVASNVRQEC